MLSGHRVCLVTEGQYIIDAWVRTNCWSSWTISGRIRPFRKSLWNRHQYLMEVMSKIVELIPCWEDLLRYARFMYLTRYVWILHFMLSSIRIASLSSSRGRFRPKYRQSCRVYITYYWRKLHSPQLFPIFLFWPVGWPDLNMVLQFVFGHRGYGESQIA